MWKLQCPPPHEKSHPPSFPATPSKSWGPVKPPLFENLVGSSTSPLAERGGGAHYEVYLLLEVTKLPIVFSKTKKS